MEKQILVEPISLEKQTFPIPNFLILQIFFMQTFTMRQSSNKLNFISGHTLDIQRSTKAQIFTKRTFMLDQILKKQNLEKKSVNVQVKAKTELIIVLTSQLMTSRQTSLKLISVKYHILAKRSFTAV